MPRVTLTKKSNMLTIVRLLFEGRVELTLEYVKIEIRNSMQERHSKQFWTSIAEVEEGR